ncbi:MAG: SGNH/GDSL hydrolase family protein [Pseudonocardia sediminis]
MTTRLITAIAAAALLLLGSAAAAGASEKPRYVNMGDSYSAGAGIAPFAPGGPPQCSRSAANWAHDIARDRGYRLVDVSCSGAKTKDFATSQRDGVAPQLDALGPDTDLVTMTIGGNDNDVYADAYGGCAKIGLTTGGRGNPCEQRFGTRFVDAVNDVSHPDIVEALQAVRAKAPNARVAVSGYLQILPPDRGCFPVVPVAAGDIAYLNRVQVAFNDAVRRAAEATGVTYLDVTGLSAGHDACRAPGVRWVEPLVPINAAPAHPNARGERAMADNAIALLGL